MITNSGTANGTTHFVHDQWGNIIAELDATGATVREYIWLVEAEIAPTRGSRTTVDRPIAVVSNVNTTPALLMVHVDHLNRPIKMTDASKAVVWDAVWLPWGAPYQITGPEALEARFPGQWFQLEAGLHYNWHRHYDPSLGRYTQPDPLGFVDGPSVYAYAGSKPLGSVDRNGLYCASANGVTTCSAPNNGPTFRVPTPAGFPDRLDDRGPLNFVLYHFYDIQRGLGCSNPNDVFHQMAQSPTPGDPMPATRNGTANNARVLGVDNYVTSYLTSDIRTGLPVVVNIAGVNDGSLFGPGYVARYVRNGIAHSAGEGLNYKQSPILTGEELQYFANESLWGGQMENFISRTKANCGCRR